MSRGPDAPGNANKVTHGTVIDYKLDVAGLGVFFVLDLGPRAGNGARYVERYRKLPPA